MLFSGDSYPSASNDDLIWTRRSNVILVGLLLLDMMDSLPTYPTVILPTTRLQLLDIDMSMHSLSFTLISCPSWT